jgi:diguanylate cyclase (GGDEF)-like protein
MDPDARILVVDDDDGSRQALSALLMSEGYEVETARNGLDALECVRDGRFDLVISDVQMPGLDGFAMVRNLRRITEYRDLPVILVSGQANPDRRTIGLHLGADDFMAKPLDFDELLARIQIQLRHTERNRQLLLESLRDELTGMLNRRGILQVLTCELKDAQREESHTSVLMIDLNDFKRINDTRGHAAGDEVLRSVAESIRTTIRARDRVGRLGGDEFLVVLTNTDAEEAHGLIDRIRQCSSVASLAVGSATGQGADLADVLIRRADEAMYADKRRGRRSSRNLQSSGPGHQK